ncbi:glycosyltransferase family 2 protein [Kiloniella laminariae]|uniref:glycosyltransferase family 2 protein n=1 Tax=Kiloniella laminariae TaxID=454162 RepID=UPI00037B91DA|nr:glycosyltransferase family 2 protein [Kiloniella laminariae]
MDTFVDFFSNKKVLIVSERLTQTSLALYLGLRKSKKLGEWSALFVEECDGQELGDSISLLPSVKEKYGISPPFMPLKSFCLFKEICDLQPDLVIFDGSPALGHYSLLSRSQADILGGVSIWLYRPVARAYQLEKAAAFPSGRTDLELNALEKDAFSKFDLVLDNENSDFVNWFELAGWGMSQLALIAENDDIASNKIADIEKNIFKELKEYREPIEKVPDISVCIVTFNRPDYLSEALKSIEYQSRQVFEVIIIDDGSSLPNLVKLKALEEKYRKRGWTFYYQDNFGPAKARNFAASMATGEYLLFMDDDNWALANEIEVFAQAAQKSDADIFTCIPGWHPDSELCAGTSIKVISPDTFYPVVSLDWLPLGGYAELGVLINCFGDTNALYRKKMFDALGGYKEDRTFILEDMEFFTRAVLEAYQLEVVPEVLFLYRKHSQSRTGLKDPIFSSHLHSMSAYLNLSDDRLWPLLLCLRKGFYDRHRDISKALDTHSQQITTGEWVTITKENTKFFLEGGRFEDDQWFAQKNSKLSFYFKDPGRFNSLIFECTGPGDLIFVISERRYDFINKFEKEKNIIECPLLPGAINHLGETTISFLFNNSVGIHRFAIMKNDE